MSYTIITDTEITTGEPVASSTQQKIKGNFENHEERIVAVENGGTTVYAPIIMRVNGLYSTEWVLDNILKTTSNFNFAITGIRLFIDKAGTSGTTEVSVKWKRGVGAWTSVCTTNPSVASSAGDDVLSSNAVLNSSNVNIQAGDIIRLDLVSAQINARNFFVRIDFNKT